jgi:hypothetical protein
VSESCVSPPASWPAVACVCGWVASCVRGRGSWVGRACLFAGVLASCWLAPWSLACMLVSHARFSTCAVFYLSILSANGYRDQHVVASPSAIG